MNAKDESGDNFVSSFTNKKYDNNKFQYIKRYYGIDLLRIISMINVINLHLNLISKELIKYKSPKFFNIWRLEVFSYWAVDCFGLISGIVGYKRHKFSNLIYMWFLVCFYSSSTTLFLFIIKQIKIKDLILSLFPILIKRQWYFNAYFSMYLLLPFINHGINSLNRKIYRNIIIFFICFYSFYNIIAVLFVNNNYHYLMNGYSSMWLTILYIIGAYFGKYIIINKNRTGLFHFLIYFLLYISCSILSSEIKFKLMIIKSKIPDGILISYLSPTILFQAISLIMCFSRLNIKNKYIIKIISFLSPLTFSALLIHCRLLSTDFKPIKFIFKIIKEFKKDNIFFKVYAISIIIYFLCIFIDYFRFLIFKLFKIREFCLLLENKIPKIFDQILCI